MGIVNDLKKIFFGASSVTKSAAESAGDFIKEEGTEIFEKGKDVASAAGKTVLDKTSGLKDAVVGSSGGLLEDAKNTLSDTVESISDSPILQGAKEKLTEIGEGLAENPLVQSAQETAENLGSKVLEKGGEVGEKFTNVAENLGSKIIDGGGEASKKGLDMAEGVGEKLLEAKDRVSERASEIGDQISSKLDETMEKAQAWEAEQAKLPPKGEFAEKDLTAGGSLLDGTDDFFSKADKFADGEYDTFSEGKIEVSSENIDNIKAIEPSPMAGFEDLDGDGNPLIDDIEIIDDADA